MNELKLFKNEQFGEVRTAVINNEPYFMLADICRVLDIKDQTTAKRRLSKKGVHTMRTLTNGGNQQATFINESNLYKLAFTSRKKEAEAFTEWVTSEVLPAIRKHGMYATEETIENMLANPENAIKIFTALKEEREARKELEQKLTEAEPKLTYYDTILQSKNTMTSTQVAADYGMSAIRLNRILAEQRFIRRVNGQWVLYAEYMKKGYEDTKTYAISANSSKTSTVWTQKGRLKIHEILGKIGIVANCDRVNHNQYSYQARQMARQQYVQ